MKEIESILSNDRIRPIPEQQKTLLEKKFIKTTNEFDYPAGVRFFSSYLRRHPDEFDEKVFCRLGLLVDHLAFKASQKKARRAEQLALKIYSYVLARKPDSHKATWGIGRVYLHRNSRKALPYAKRAFYLSKKAGTSIGMRAQCVGLVYENLGEYRNAAHWLKRGIRENPKDWGMHLNLVGFFRLRKQFRAAQQQAILLKQLVEKEPVRFLKTPWGKKILEVVRDAGKPLPKIKKTAR